MIDWCVTVTGPNVDVLFRLFFGSLQRYSNLNDVRFHILDRGCNEVGLRQIHESLQRYHYIVYDQLGKNQRDVGPSDVANNYDWMVRNCGTEKWVVISHFDVVFKKDFLSRMVGVMTDNVGMVGNCCAVVAVNREAYKQSVLKFCNSGGYVVQPIKDGTGDYKLRCSQDARVTAEALQIRGFDVGELLELEMCSRGWAVHPLTVWLEEGDHHEWYDHHGGGGSHWGEPYLSMHRERALRLTQEGGY